MVVGTGENKMEKLKLFRIYDIVSEGNCVVSAKKEFIADLEVDDDAVKYSKDEELYIMKFDENDELIGIDGVCHCGFEIDESYGEIYEEYGEYVPPYVDCAEWDYRVYASVAFGADLMRGKVRTK